MKKYETPVLEITELQSSDIITASTGDSPFVSYEW